MAYLDKMKILYIEDDAETREALKRFLKRRCGKVVAAQDAESALEIVETYDPDIMIVDLLLPGINGLDFIDRIHASGQKDETKIVITTTVNEIDTVIDSIDKDISAYIRKPFDLNVLEEKLEQIAAKIQISAANKSRHSSFANKDNQGVISDNIRVDFLKLIKSKSGKGPAKVNIVLQADSIDILALDALTAYEKAILYDRHNGVLIEQVREIFYKSLKGQMEQILFEKSGINFMLEKVRIDINRKVDHLSFIAE